MKPLTLFWLCLLLSACATAPSNTGQHYGVMVMAHGGGPEWNAQVRQAVEPLQQQQPTEIAFGMADAAAMEAAVRRLEARGVTQVGVVRLFVSGDSFLAPTEQILGLAPGAPDKPADAEPATDDHHHHPMHLWRIETGAQFKLSDRGLLHADPIETVLEERARDLSRNPKRERVLILGHGPASDEENRRWLAMMEQRAAGIRDMGFSALQVETLREDWPKARKVAEQRIKAFVEAGNRADETVLVIPFRVSGFGPYHEVLEGLDYKADGRGFLPHPTISTWLQDQASQLQRQFATEG